METQFKVDVGDVMSIPGLLRPWGGFPPFLTPVFFNKEVLVRYFYDPRYLCEFHSETYGTVRAKRFSFPFGINPNGRVVAWLGDLEELPDAEQQYLLAENTESDGNITSEFYDAQINCEYTSPIREIEIILLKTKISEATHERYGFTLFTNTRPAIDEVLQMCSRYRRMIFNSPDDLKRFVSEWNETLVEDIRVSELKGWLKSHSVPFKEGIASLKALEVFLKAVLGDKNNIIAPLFYLNDLRIWADHKNAEDKFTEIIAKLGLQPDSVPAQLYSRLTESLYSFLMSLFAILVSPDVLITSTLLLISMSLACSIPGTTQEKAVAAKQKADGKQSEELQNHELQKQIEQIASAAKGRVGVAAVMLEEEKADGSGQEAETPNSNSQIVSLNPHDHFPMQSVYKLPIGMALLKQVDAGKIKLDQKVRVTKRDLVSAAAYSPIRDKYPNGVELSVGELLRFAISESDGTASDVLLRLAGGPEAVNAYLHELKITDMIVLNTENEFSRDHSLQYRNWASPEAAVALLRALHERRGLSETSQALLLKLMTESPTGPKRLKGLLPAGTIVAHKTGTSGTENGVTAATNDIGIVMMPAISNQQSAISQKQFAIAVFVADSPADQETREGVIAKIARVIWDEWSQQ
jgi:beta-lactamase class A